MNPQQSGEADEPCERELTVEAIQIRQYVLEGIEEADRGETSAWNTAEIVAKAQQQHDLTAIKEAITQWEAGDEGLPVDEAMAEIRTKHKARTPTSED